MRYNASYEVQHKHKKVKPIEVSLWPLSASVALQLGGLFIDNLIKT